MTHQIALAQDWLIAIVAYLILYLIYKLAAKGLSAPLRTPLTRIGHERSRLNSPAARSNPSRSGGTTFYMDTIFTGENEWPTR